MFKEIHPIELEIGELRILDAAAGADWTKVRPSIFGNIFEGAFQSDEGKKKRHAHGIHFTSEGDIKRIVLPTIVDYWGDRIAAAHSLDELQVLHRELSEYKILDPACGSGNFLYVAYQDLKAVEFDLLQRLQLLDPSRSYQSLVTPQQFFGMDINSFAVELAKVTLMIGRTVAIRKLDLPENSLPLDTLDKNIVCADALFTDWVKADAIIGNPPFLGGSRIRKELTDDYAERVFARFGEIHAQVDFASYWFRLAHECLDRNGRAGLVATNSISQGKSRAVSLDYIVQNGGYIYDAVSTQVWSGEAKVHVSIVNWSYQKPQICYLDNQFIPSINSSLKSTIDVSQAVKIKANFNHSFIGCQLNGNGFVVSKEKASQWIKDNPLNEKVLRPFSVARDLTQNPHGNPEQWIIDFNDLSIEDASGYILPFQHVKATVKPERDINRRETRKLNWWQYGENCQKMRRFLAPLSFYFTIPRHSKWFIFTPAEVSWLPNCSNAVIASEEFYTLGILTSKIYRVWVTAQSSTLKGDTRYTPNTCFENFPFPQFAKDLPAKSKLKTEKIRTIMQELHQYRSQQMETKQWGTTKLYNEYFHEPASQLYKLHAKLDKLVMEAYGFSENDDLLSKLLELNLELAEREKQGLPVIGARGI